MEASQRCAQDKCKRARASVSLCRSPLTTLRVRAMRSSSRSSLHVRLHCCSIRLPLAAHLLLLVKNWLFALVACGHKHHILVSWRVCSVFELDSQVAEDLEVMQGALIIPEDQIASRNNTQSSLRPRKLNEVSVRVRVCVCVCVCVGV